ncbi:hypothetical protein RclHR1_02090011 [Rhizophagus clarus]|uniref:Uncharacterized protein n=1 Tax=Rhizophagus clarus TaxID=94130 RepID=A0A2Z6QS76_9GLOM|nr:hypothetical protein RclHR1_02090011 [Rhizophagus clarus]
MCLLLTLRNFFFIYKVLPDEKHDRTFGIKVREVLPDEKYNQTFGIKYCQMKNMTRLLELSVARDEKYDWTFGIKMKSMTRLLEFSVARRKIRCNFWN